PQRSCWPDRRRAGRPPTYFYVNQPSPPMLQHRREAHRSWSIESHAHLADHATQTLSIAQRHPHANADGEWAVQRLPSRANDTPRSDISATAASEVDTEPRRRQERQHGRPAESLIVGVEGVEWSLVANVELQSRQVFGEVPRR